MHKTDLQRAVSEKTGMTLKDTAAVIDAAIATIQETVADGVKVSITGFGTFEARDRKERQGQNPRKPGEKITIPATTVPVFKAGKEFKDAVLAKIQK